MKREDLEYGALAVVACLVTVTITVAFCVVGSW